MQEKKEPGDIVKEWPKDDESGKTGGEEVPGKKGGSGEVGREGDKPQPEKKY